MGAFCVCCTHTALSAFWPSLDRNTGSQPAKSRQLILGLCVCAAPTHPVSIISIWYTDISSVWERAAVQPSLADLSMASEACSECWGAAALGSRYLELPGLAFSFIHSLLSLFWGLADPSDL